MSFRTEPASRSPGRRRPCTRAIGTLPVLTALLGLAGCRNGHPAGPETDIPAVLAAESPTLQYVSSVADAPAPAVVRVRDSVGRALVRTRVRYSATAGALEITSGILRTDTTGRVRLPRWLARDARPYQVDVRVGNGAPVTFRVVTLPGAIMGGDDARSCPLIDQRLPHFQNLVRSAARLQAGQPLTIVALGSSSTFGTGLTTQDEAYPAQLQGMLQRGFPGSTITVLNAGIPGNSSDQLDARLDSDVLAHAPDLVVLQTGTNDALKRLPFDVVREYTRRTITRLQERGIDVVLLDPQRFRGAGESEEYRQYIALVTGVADSLGVSTARRYGWMSAAIDAQRYGYADLLTADGLHQSALAHRCTAHLLATGIAVAALEATRP
ncbi:MAG: hypothetical protein IT355_10025 [Gemmatimonadaceae bacterium]|nr:hypothetical protein [Gemmatimonadaceae bacterium]